MSEKVILHCDCNNFYASVEEKLNPELKNIPMAVTGDPENRHGIILAKNQLAKKYAPLTPTMAALSPFSRWNVTSCRTWPSGKPFDIW